MDNAGDGEANGPARGTPRQTMRMRAVLPWRSTNIKPVTWVITALTIRAPTCGAPSRLGIRLRL